MLEIEQLTPLDLVFRDDLFARTCKNVQNRNEARVIQNITQLIVLSLETLNMCGAINVKYLIENVNES